MNYIRHLNNAWKKLVTLEKATPHHISIYFTVFQLWNKSRWQNPLSVKREEVMWLAKVGSVTTYTRCMKQLHVWEFWEYKASFNPLVGTVIHLYSFEHAESNAEPVYTLYSNINSNKPKTAHTPNLNEVKLFFKSLNKNGPEAELFFHHYQANGWLQGGKTPILDWQEAAQSWALRAAQITNSLPKSGQAQHKGHEPSSENYSEPL